MMNPWKRWNEIEDPIVKYAVAAIAVAIAVAFVVMFGTDLLG